MKVTSRIFFRAFFFVYNPLVMFEKQKTRMTVIQYKKHRTTKKTPIRMMNQNFESSLLI
jgi:hypothetical protein